MKRYFYMILIAAFALGCDSKYSDEFDNLKNEIDDLEAKFEELSDKTNDNLDALEELVRAIESNDYITSIEPVYEDGVEIGYKIKFFKGDTIVVYNGRDGIDGAPGEDGEDGEDGSDGSHGSDGESLTIGVKQGNDGKWYWTVNGTWMRDAEGNKVPASPTDGKDGEDGEDGKDGEDGSNGANGDDGRPGADGEDGKDGADGKDGVTPKLKIVDGYWYLSVDGGNTWTEYGKATGNAGQDGQDGKVPEIVFSDVYYDSDNVYFVMKSGDVISIPLKKPFAITLEQTTDVPVKAGGEISIGYTITGVDDETEVECICEGGWKAEIVKENFFSGKVNVRAPYPFSEGKVVVMATKPDGSLVMQSISFVEIESEPVLLSYCDDPDELDGWDEALCTGDGTMIIGRAQEDGGYLIGISKYEGEVFALVSLAPEGYIREVYSLEGISIFENNTPILLTKSWDASNTAGALGLFNNIVSIYEGMEDIADGGKLSIAGVLLAAIDHVNNVIKTISGEDILSKNPALADTLKYSGGLVDIAGALSGVSWLGLAAVYANLLGTYLELYEEHIEAYYGNCAAQISDIEVDGSNVKINVTVAGWESYYNTLEVGVAVSDFVKPSMGESSQISSLTHNGEYTFTESGLKVGATYHCRPFVADKGRESIWIGFIGDIAGPLLRYGKDVSFSIPKPSASTGDVIDTEDKSAVVGCSFTNVPSGASCGIEVDETRTFSADKDAEQVTLSGLTPATTYSYRAYVKYQGETYYGSSKSFTTDLPDVTGTWTCKEKHYKNTGEAYYQTFTVTLHKDGSVTTSKYDDFVQASWSRTATGLSVGIITMTSYFNGIHWAGSDAGDDMSITFDDPSNPTSGNGSTHKWVVSAAHGTGSNNYYELEMSR